MILTLDWKSLADVARQNSNQPGIYVLGAPFRIAYGSTESRVFYIGSSRNLQKRLVSHLNSTERGNILLLRFANPAKDNIVACAFCFPLLDANKLLELEGEAIYSFGLKHGFIPHGNRIPESRSSLDSQDSFRDQVEIVETSSIPLDLLNEIDIAAKYKLRVDRYPYPIYNSLSASLEFVGSEVKVIRAEESPKIYSLNFMFLPASISKQKPKPKASSPT
jgi:hypothetical protein